MKLSLEERQQRAMFAETYLTDAWDCRFWTRDQQIEAASEGWALTINDVGNERIVRSLNYRMPYICPFGHDDQAIAYVLERAQEGSDLHCRALALHTASVLKNGK